MDKHLPTKCPMLPELGLKLIEVGGALPVDPKLAVVLPRQAVPPVPLGPKQPQRSPRRPLPLMRLQQV